MKVHRRVLKLKTIRNNADGEFDKENRASWKRYKKFIVFNCNIIFILTVKMEMARNIFFFNTNNE